MPLPDSNIVWPPLELDTIDLDMKRWSAWFSGDPHQLQEAYIHGRDHHHGARPRPSTYRGGLVGTIARTFWGAPRADLTQQPKSKLHVALAGDICQASADLLFAEPPKFKVDDTPTNDRLTELAGDGMLSTLAETAEITAALGGGYLRVTWDQQIEPDAPFFTAVDADGAWPEFRWGHLTAVTFWFDVTPVSDTTGDRRLRHLERHELAPNGNGVILHGLYEGTRENLGRLVPLNEAPATAALADIVAEGNMVDTLTPGLSVTYVPNQRPQRRWRHDPIGRHLGRSDLDGVEGLMDALDETYTSWMRDVRLGKARIFVAQQMLEGRGAGYGAAFDMDRELYAPLETLATGKDASMSDLVHAEQFAIRFAEHQATATALIENVLRTAGYSTQTFGMDSDTAGNTTATEIQARQQRSYMTRDRKIRLWRPAITNAIEKLLYVDQAVFGSQIKPARPDVIFSDGIQDSQLVVAQTAQALRTAQAASTKTLVEMAHPDWDKDQVAAEVALIASEAAAAVPDPFGGPAAHDAVQPPPFTRAGA